MMKKLALFGLAALAAATAPAAAQTTVRVGWCAKTITSAIRGTMHNAATRNEAMSLIMHGTR